MVVNDKGVRFARIFDGTKKPPHFHEAVNRIYISTVPVCGWAGLITVHFKIGQSTTYVDDDLIFC